LSLPDHTVQTINLGVRIRRLARDQQAGGNMSVFAAELLHHCHCLILGIANCEQNFECGIILFEKRAQVSFEAAVKSIERLQNAYRNSEVERRRLNREI